MPKLWFSYSFPPGMTLDSPEPNRSPYHHTWHLGRFLRDKARELGYEFEYVNLDSTDPVTIGEDDICIYHAWFTEGCFSLQVTEQPCKAKFIVQPYTEQMVGKEALPLLHKQWGHADHLFLNTGPWWFDRLPRSDYAHYYEKSTRLDNTVNPDLHPFSKTKWNEAGKRGFFTIGYDNPIKGMDKVEELARVGGLRLLHLGNVSDGFWQHVPQATSMSGLEFMPHTIEWLCEHYDFFITMGRFDANPTALSETALWGLIPCCTPQCGYYPNEPFIGLDLDDLVHNLDIVEWLQYAPAPELVHHQHRIREHVLEQHRFDTRIKTIWDKITEWL